MNEVTKRFVETYKAMGLTGYKMGKSSNIITKQKNIKYRTRNY